MLLDVPMTGSPGLDLDLQRGAIVHFARCPIPLPPDDDLRFLREELGRHLGGKNVSWYPAGDRLSGLDAPRAVRARARAILQQHAGEVQALLSRLMPDFMRGAHLGISSFRPMEEQGRNLSAHASNERIHVDAGAYGATHGDRILRFFINVHPTQDRVWISRGNFAALYRRWGERAGIPPVTRSLEPGPLEGVFTGILQAAQPVLPALRLVDTSPYDRLMRRFHNFMKDSPAFREADDDEERFVFRPGSAWMVLSDAVSHACLSGQHALVDTLSIPVANCTLPEHTPYHVLAGAFAAPAMA